MSIGRSSVGFFKLDYWVNIQKLCLSPYFQYKVLLLVSMTEFVSWSLTKRGPGAAFRNSGSVLPQSPCFHFPEQLQLYKPLFLPAVWLSLLAPYELWLSFPLHCYSVGCFMFTSETQKLMRRNSASGIIFPDRGHFSGATKKKQPLVHCLLPEEFSDDAV